MKPPRRCGVANTSRVVATGATRGNAQARWPDAPLRACGGSASARPPLCLGQHAFRVEASVPKGGPGGEVPRSNVVPKPMQAAYDAVVALTDASCRDHLNDEYRDLARAMSAVLSRKRPSPLASGQPRTWACGIIHTLGRLKIMPMRRGRGAHGVRNWHQHRRGWRRHAPARRVRAGATPKCQTFGPQVVNRAFRPVRRQAVYPIASPRGATIHPAARPTAR